MLQIWKITLVAIAMHNLVVETLRDARTGNGERGRQGNIFAPGTSFTFIIHQSNQHNGYNLHFETFKPRHHSSRHTQPVTIPSTVVIIVAGRYHFRWFGLRQAYIARLNTIYFVTILWTLNQQHQQSFYLLRIVSGLPTLSNMNKVSAVTARAVILCEIYFRNGTYWSFI